MSGGEIVMPEEEKKKWGDGKASEKSEMGSWGLAAP